MGDDGRDALMRRGIESLAKRTRSAELFVTPVADIYETADAFVMRLDMPGVTKDSVSISVKPGYLSATGTIGPHHTEGSNLILSEIGRKSYFREFNLGDGIDEKNIEGQLEDGVLTIRLPKTDKMKIREIPIK